MPPPHHTLPLPPPASAGHRSSYRLFPACISLDLVVILACSAFIAQRPFVVTQASIIIGRQQHTLHLSSGIIVDSLQERPKLYVHSRSRP